MPEQPAWKTALREPNAIGWIAFFILVVGIGAGTLYFGSDDTRTANSGINPAGEAAK
jgi:hypothetical protein